MGETKKTVGIEVTKASLGCLGTVLAAIIGGIFLLISAQRTAKNPTPSPDATSSFMASTEGLSASATVSPNGTISPPATQASFGNGEQTWIKRTYLPEEEIRECWNKEHYLTG